jgi:hypothetical protein
MRQLSIIVIDKIQQFGNYFQDNYYIKYISVPLRSNSFLMTERNY